MIAIILFVMLFCLLGLMGACCGIAVAGAFMQAEKWLRDKRQVDWGSFASRGGYDEFCKFFTELGLEEEKEELQQGKEYVFASIEID